MDFKRKYKEMVSQIRENDLYVDFLKFCGGKNILDFSVYNQMSVFCKLKSATELHEYDEWIKLGYLPRKKEGILVLTREMSEGILYDISSVVQMKKEGVRENRLDVSNGFFDYEITESLVKDTVLQIFVASMTFSTIKKSLISEKISEDDVINFVVKSIMLILKTKQNCKFQLDERYNETKRLLLSYKDCIYIWFQPYINKISRDIEKKIIREGYIDEQHIVIEKYGFDEMENKNRKIHSDNVSATIPDVGAKRRIGVDYTRESTGSCTFTEESFEILQKKLQSVEHGAVTRSGEQYRENSVPGIKDNKLENDEPHILVSKIENEIFYGSYIAKASDNTRYNSNSDFFVVGTFDNYYECSKALEFYRKSVKISDDFRVFPKDNKEQKIKYIQESFRSKFEEYYCNSCMLRVNSDVYRKIYIYEDDMSIKSSTIIAALQKIDEFPSYIKAYMSDILREDNQNDRIYHILKDKEFKELLGIDNEELGYSQNSLYIKEDNVYLKYRPYLITGKQKIHDVVNLQMPIKQFVDLMKMIFFNPDYEITLKDEIYLSQKEKEVCLMLERYMKKNKIQHVLSFIYPDNIKNNKEIDNLLHMEYFDVLKNMDWSRKYELAYKYEHCNSKEIIGYIKFIYDMAYGKKIFPVKNPNSDQIVSINAKEKGMEVLSYENGKFLRTILSYEEIEHIIYRSICEKNYWNENDFVDREHYIQELTDKIESRIEKNGLNTRCLEILKNVNSRKMSNIFINTQEAAEITFMNLLVDNNHKRYRKYLKEVFMQKDLSVEKKSEFLCEIINKYFYKFWGNCDGRIINLNKEGLSIYTSYDLFGDSTYKKRCPVTYDSEYMIPFKDVYKIVEETVCQESYKVNEHEKLYGSSGRFPEGFCKFYNEFKVKNKLKSIYDTSNDVDEPGYRERNNNKHDYGELVNKEYEQLDLFSYAIDKEKKTDEIVKNKRKAI